MDSNKLKLLNCRNRRLINAIQKKLHYSVTKYKSLICETFDNVVISDCFVPIKCNQYLQTA